MGWTDKALERLLRQRAKYELRKYTKGSKQAASIEGALNERGLRNRFVALEKYLLMRQRREVLRSNKRSNNE